MKKISVISVLLICLLPSIHGMIFKELLIKKTKLKQSSLSPEVKKLVGGYCTGPLINTEEIVLIDSSLVSLDKNVNKNRREVAEGVTHIHQIKYDKFEELNSPIFKISNEINSKTLGLFAVENLQENFLDCLIFFKSIKIFVRAVIFDGTSFGKRCEDCKEMYKIEGNSLNIINVFDSACSPKKNKQNKSDPKNNRKNANPSSYDSIMHKVKQEEKKNKCSFKKNIEFIRSQLKELKEEFSPKLFVFSALYKIETIEKFVGDFNSLKN